MVLRNTRHCFRWRCFLGLSLLAACCYPRAMAQSIEEMLGFKQDHCSIAQGAVDGKTFACMVWDDDPVKFSEPDQIEVYRGHKRVFTIVPGAPIREWHFWQDGRKLAVNFGAKDGPGQYALYDTQTGRRIEHTLGTRQVRMLPQWAKSPSQLAEESLPEGSAFSQQETLWIGKVLEVVGTIRPGMSRGDLLKVFKEEGGLSTRTQRTYVFKECPYIKVDVVFSVVGASGMTESNADQLVSISRPYLGYSIMD